MVQQMKKFHSMTRTSRQDDADDLRNSLNESTLRFVGNMSDDELNGQTLKYFVIPYPPTSTRCMTPVVIDDDKANGWMF